MEYGLTTLMSADFGGAVSIVFLVGLVWTLAWTGWALWIAAKKDSKPWFVALLVLNTFGILEILYIFVFSNWGKITRDEGLISEAEIKKEVEKVKTEKSSEGNSEEVKN